MALTNMLSVSSLTVANSGTPGRLFEQPLLDLGVVLHHAVARCRRLGRVELVAVLLNNNACRCPHIVLAAVRLLNNGDRHVHPDGGLLVAVLLPLKIGWIHFSLRDHT